MAAKKLQPIGDKVKEDILNDVRGIELDINDLVSKYIAPIDQFRSYVSPDVKASLDQAQKLTIASSYQESRCHTFYRMLGLPSIDSSGNFFNPGYPTVDDYKDRQADIAERMRSSAIKQYVAIRESSAQQRLNRFSIRNVDSTVFALVLAAPNCSRHFSIVGSATSLELPCPQLQTIPARKQYIAKFFKNRDGSEITDAFENVTHVLAPFMTDPVIASNITGVPIGLPFMKHKDLEWTNGRYVQRPGLEFIIRLRLRQQSLNKLIAQTQSNTPPTIDTSSSQSDIKSAMSDVGVGDYDLKKLFPGGKGLVEKETIDDLLRTYYGLINLYYRSLKSVESVGKQIAWVPLPNIGGPEAGTVVSLNFVVPKTYQNTWDIERRILQLQTKSVLAKTQLDIGTDDGTIDGTALSFGDFTISEFQSMAEKFDNDLANQQSMRDDLEAQGSAALRVVELISGEVSGFGLIDIIAIYLALWAVDVSVLLDLIDDSAAKRLKNIPDLMTDSAQDRVKKIGNSNAKDAYAALASKIVDILAYGDRIFTELKGTPNDHEAGDVERSSG
jgi:hypothetical protein